MQVQAANTLPPLTTTYDDVDDINNATTLLPEQQNSDTHELAALAKANDLLLTSYMAVTDDLNRVLHDKTDVATEMEWIIERVPTSYNTAPTHHHRRHHRQIKRMRCQQRATSRQAHCFVLRTPY